MSNFPINDNLIRDAVRREKITYKDKDGKEHTITETTIKPSKSGAVAGAAAGGVVAAAAGIAAAPLVVAGGVIGFIFGDA